MKNTEKLISVLVENSWELGFLILKSKNFVSVGSLGPPALEAVQLLESGAPAALGCTGERPPPISQLSLATFANCCCFLKLELGFLETRAR